MPYPTENIHAAKLEAEMTIACAGNYYDVVRISLIGGKMVVQCVRDTDHLAFTFRYNEDEIVTVLA